MLHIYKKIYILFSLYLFTKNQTVQPVVKINATPIQSQVCTTNSNNGYLSTTTATSTMTSTVPITTTKKNSGVKLNPLSLAIFISTLVLEKNIL